MPDGGKIEVAIMRSDVRVCVRISDTGPGVPKNIQGSIFKPFFTTKGEKGAGLGLAICSKIVTQHGGKILLESGEGEGAVFTVCLPACTASE
jgi:signal transduction histidine kinase